MRAIATAASLAVVLAGCDGNSPEPHQLPSSSATTGTASPSFPPIASLSPSPRPSAPTLDTGALDERKDPQRVLRFYAAALHARDWAAAAKAWGEGSGVTAAMLRQAYERADPPTLDLGTGQQEGAAGSSYYEVPVRLRFGSGAQPARGNLTLRRVNDIEGATPEQLRWHIERSTIGPRAKDR